MGKALLFRLVSWVSLESQPATGQKALGSHRTADVWQVGDVSIVQVQSRNPRGQNGV